MLMQQGIKYFANVVTANATTESVCCLNLHIDEFKNFVTASGWLCQGNRLVEPKGLEVEFFP
jgi:hypothetical protein